MRQPVINVVKGISCAAVFLCGIGSANAQTPAAVAVVPLRRQSKRRSRSRLRLRRQPRTPSPMDSRWADSPSSREGGSSWTSSATSIRSAPRIPSIRARSPSTAARATNSNLHAKETRLFLDVRGPVEGKELRMYVETDFYGSSSVLRLRQAYGSYGGLLAGQTWSTFVDDNNFPNTIDFESPMAFPSIRQAQLRWTQKLSAKVSWSAAVEDNKSTITPPAAIPGKAEYPMPDLVTRIRLRRVRAATPSPPAFSAGRASVQTTGEPDDVTLWGMLLSGRIKTVGKDYAYAQFTFGDGVGRYRGGVTAVPDTNGELQRRRAPRVHGRLRALLGRSRLVERGLQPGDGARRRTSIRGRFQQAARLHRRQPSLLVPAGPRVGRRRVSVRPPRGLRRPDRHRQSASVRGSFQFPYS